MGDGVEEVVVARVEHGVAHAAEDSKHGTTAVLDLNVEGTVTGIDVLDLSGVASRDERRGAVVASRKVLGSSGVLAGGHGDSLGEEAEESDLQLLEQTREGQKNECDWPSPNLLRRRGPSGHDVDARERAQPAGIKTNRFPVTSGDAGLDIDGWGIRPRPSAISGAESGSTPS